MTEDDKWWSDIKPAKVAGGVRYLNARPLPGSIGKATTLGTLSVTEGGLQWRARLGIPKVTMPWPTIQAVAVEGEVSSRVKVGAVMAVGILGLGAKKRREDTHVSVITDEGDFGFLLERTPREVVTTRLGPLLRALQAQAP